MRVCAKIGTKMDDVDVIAERVGVCGRSHSTPLNARNQF